MDTFSACLAFGPLAIYLLLLGLMNLRRRPLVVSGTREMLSLALALGGLVIIGPMQLFMPQEAAGQFGPYVWALLAGFYILAVTLAIMLSRPRLVVYNISGEQLREALVATAERLDHDATWAGKSLSMPQLRVHLTIESFSPLQNVSLVATAEEQSASGWWRLEGALRQTLGETPIVVRSHGGWLVLCAMMILLLLTLRVFDDPQTVARGVDRLLNP